jgi:hypothetical protein
MKNAPRLGADKYRISRYAAFVKRIHSRRVLKLLLYILPFFECVNFRADQALQVKTICNMKMGTSKCSSPLFESGLQLAVDQTVHAELRHERVRVLWEGLPQQFCDCGVMLARLIAGEF